MGTKTAIAVNRGGCYVVSVSLSFFTSGLLYLFWRNGVTSVWRKLFDLDWPRCITILEGCRTGRLARRPARCVSENLYGGFDHAQAYHFAEDSEGGSGMYFSDATMWDYGVWG